MPCHGMQCDAVRCRVTCFDYATRHAPFGIPHLGYGDRRRVVVQSLSPIFSMEADTSVGTLVATRLSTESSLVLSNPWTKIMFLRCETFFECGQFSKLNLDKCAQPLGDLNFQRAFWIQHKQWFWDLRPLIWIGWIELMWSDRKGSPPQNGSPGRSRALPRGATSGVTWRGCSALADASVSPRSVPTPRIWPEEFGQVKSVPVCNSG